MGQPFDVPAPLPLAEQAGQTFPALVRLMQRLLAPDGCPWDREQSYMSLRQYVIEEACEVIDAIEANDLKALREELGDLALQVVFLAELARKEKEHAFGPDDVVRDIVDKLVRRHPHVFGDVNVEDSETVLKNWEAIKLEEKKKRPLLDNVPRSLPALLGATKLSDRAAKVGFDWPDGRGSREKVNEEIAELDEAEASGDKAHLEHELGDLMFALVNYARHHGLDAEVALRKTNDRFRRRFNHVETRVRAEHGDWPRREGKPIPGVSLEEMEDYWREAKEKGL
jgi:tetrapyrrole methylase family protein/MazG family protein/ATP diphosphatase